MKKKKIFRFGFLLFIFNLICFHLFAGTGGANDGQVMLLVILGVLSSILGILYFFPRLVHLFRTIWNKYHNC